MSSNVQARWQAMRWGDLATLEYGRALRTHQTSRGRFRVYGTNGPIGWHDDFLSNVPGIIIGRKGAYRGVHYSPAPFFVIDTAYWLKPKVKMDIRWAYYALLTQDINGMDSGSAIPSTSRDPFYNLPVLVPPLDEQRAIASVLGSLDDKIELNRRMSETLEAIARGIFKSWFVDFDPVSAKAESRDLGLSGDTAALFPNRFQGSKLGAIPSGWCVSTIGSVLSLEYGRPLKADKRRKGNIPVYGSNGIVGWHDKAAVVGPGIVVGRKGNPGVVTWVHGDFFPIDTTFYVVPAQKRSLHFLFHTLNNQSLRNVGADSAVPGLNRNHAYANALVLPPGPILAEFEALNDSLYHRVNAAAKEVLALSDLRDVLLPKFMSGELRVPEQATAVVQ